VAALALWAMLGLESATVPTGVVRDPERTVPRATVIGMLVAGITTMLACTVVIGLLPVDVLRHSAAPMADAASRLWGPIAGIGVGVVATISCFGALNGWVLLQAQAPLAAAQDRVFPTAFAHMDGNGTPRFSLLLGGVLASILIAANYSRSLVGLFTFSILLSTAACLLPYVISVLAWWRIDPRASRLRKCVAAGALLYSLWALAGTGVESLLWAGVLVLAGLPVFLWQRHRARLRPPATA
jgi:APA family basic amino acid/polyamine antiporter